MTFLHSEQEQRIVKEIFLNSLFLKSDERNLICFYNFQITFSETTNWPYEPEDDDRQSRKTNLPRCRHRRRTCPGSQMVFARKGVDRKWPSLHRQRSLQHEVEVGRWKAGRHRKVPDRRHQRTRLRRRSCRARCSRSAVQTNGLVDIFQFKNKIFNVKFYK